MERSRSRSSSRDRRDRDGDNKAGSNVVRSVYVGNLAKGTRIADIQVREDTAREREEK